MIISDEQARLAANDLRAHRGSVPRVGPSGTCDIPEDLLERIRTSVAGLPELRSDRVEQARRDLAHGPTSDEVACKMLGRIVSDSLR